MYYTYNELYHHGVKGQRWGIRRFQNDDGSLKPAGEKRYQSSDKKRKISNRQIRKDMNNTYNKLYKELYDQYAKKDKTIAADKAYAKAKQLNTKHLVETYGKERMTKYYQDKHKKDVAIGTFFVSSLAAMSITALTINKIMK